MWTSVLSPGGQRRVSVRADVPVLSLAMAVSAAWMTDFAVARVLPGSNPNGPGMNRCIESQGIARDANGFDFEIPDCRAVVDQDPSTKLRVDPLVTPIVEIRFRGAPRWFNEVMVDGDPWPIVVEYKDLEKNWRPYGPLSPGERPEEGMSLEGGAVKARGFRLLLAPSGGEARAPEIAEVSAFFRQIDPDDDEQDGLDAAGAEYHYDWCEDYDDGWSNLAWPEQDAENLWAELDPEGWDFQGGHGDPNAAEEHFKREDNGGTNNDHVDDADLSYFAGHGETSVWDSYYLGWHTALRFNTENDDNRLTPTNVRNAWGNDDLEWMILSACEILKWSSWQFWANALSQAHLICGMSTLVFDGNYGQYLGEGLMSTGSSDPAKTLMQAWWDAVDEVRLDNYGGAYWWYSGVGVVGETSGMADDYVWYGGDVASDPDDNSTKWYWADYSFDPPSRPGRMDATSLASREGEELISFPARGRGGLDVTISPRLLRQMPPPTMLSFDVVPVTVDSGYVRGIAQDICPSLQALCGGDIGPGNEGEVNLVDGAHELRICEATGAVHYENTEQWLRPPASPPDLLTDQGAVARANQVLQNWHRLPGGNFDTSVAFVRQAMISGDPPGVEDPDSTFNIATRVFYHRRLGLDGQFRVVGPGSVTSVALGAGGSVQRVFEGGWRRLSPGPQVPIVPVEDIITELNARGFAATIHPLRTPIEQIEITGWELGYYEPGRHANAPRILPAYIFSVNATGLDGTVHSTELYVWADRLNPSCEITAPADGSEFDLGSEICFSGLASGGTAPYTYRWTDSLGNLLGASQDVCAVMEAPPDTGDGSGDLDRGITLDVRDSFNRQASAHIQVRLRRPSEVAQGTPLPSTFALTSTPNPFGGRTAIQLAIPADLGVPGGANISLCVYDATGRLVRRLLDAPLAPGFHTIEWDGKDENGHEAVSGVFFYKVRVGDRETMDRGVLLR